MQQRSKHLLMLIEARFGMKCWRLSGREASRIGIRRVGWKGWQCKRRSAESFANGSKGLATLEVSRDAFLGAAGQKKSPSKHNSLGFAKEPNRSSSNSRQDGRRNRR